MKNLKFFLIGLVAAFISCQKTYIYHPVTIINGHEMVSPYVPTNNNGEHGIIFGSYGAGTTKASVNSVSLTGYDDFKLYAWNSLNDTIMNPYIVNATAVDTYVYDNVAGQELKYFKNTADNYSFIGVLPTSKTTSIANGVVTVENIEAAVVDDNRVTDAITADSPEEFLWTYANVAKANYNSTVDLQFNHGNAVVYLGFSSDRNDTELINYVPATPDIPATPDVNDTTDTWLNLKRSYSAVGSATKLKGPGETAYTNAAALPDALVNEIKSYYSVDGGNPGDYDLHMGASVWPSNVIKKLRVVKAIPDNYKKTVELYNTGITMDFFDGFKYLQDNGYDIQPAATGGKPDVWNYILIDAFVNGSAYTVVGFNWYDSNAVPQYTVNVTPGTPAVPGNPGLEGVRMFTAKIDNNSYVHEGHALVANAEVSANGLAWDVLTNTTSVIQYSLPTVTTLNSTAKWSPTTFYAVPANPNITYLVVKLSYIYNGSTVYDVRVPIELPTEGLVAGKYYKYTIHITSTGNGTNDPGEANTDKDEIDAPNNPVITVHPIFSDYTNGHTNTITI